MIVVAMSGMLSAVGLPRYLAAHVSAGSGSGSAIVENVALVKEYAAYLAI